MFLRMLSVMLIALAMLAAPLTMREGMAVASAPVTHAAMDHESMSAMPGHCERQGDSRQDQGHKAAGNNCCIATCVAVVAPADVGELPAFHPLAERPASDADRLGTLLEIATPPPRVA